MITPSPLFIVYVAANNVTPAEASYNIWTADLNI